ncbi:MAG TPA: UDP-2,3-diacylglucosamine hydrolase [Cytophagales bacterium]|nr:UDP-2,3-diacylglucosamine hydrolase [Cytophagales bacterium]HAA23236.1 UDP-2,3-diacylglucosamine hydrolase [Cytophagales bacterium]HAP58475.1 UDP-2,3-diacylglucosamine hydrolase [Cytophagales bacterium]
MKVPETKKVYFASDFHLGVPTLADSHDRERKIVRWLDEVAQDAAYLFLLGDIFDFWFEYKRAVPRGFVRVLGKLAEITDSGIPVVMFSGNHDIWMWDYFPEELNIPVVHHPVSFRAGGHAFHVGHGDGLGPGDHVFKAVKKVFRNPLFQWLYARVHPNTGIGVAQYFSNSSRHSGEGKVYKFHGEEEWLIQYCEKVHGENPHDFYLFGHRHLPMDIPIGENGRYINLGEWMHHYTYAVYDAEGLHLKAFEAPLPSLPSF